MNLPESPDVIYLGRLSEADKAAAIRDAELVVQPSQYESFSINTLEAFLSEVPVVANVASEVLKGHCLRSQAGLYYNGFHEFDAAVTRLLTEAPLREEFGRNGARYVKDNYSWDVITGKYLDFLRRIKANT